MDSEQAARYAVGTARYFNDMPALDGFDSVFDVRRSSIPPAVRVEVDAYLSNLLRVFPVSVGQEISVRGLDDLDKKLEFLESVSDRLGIIEDIADGNYLRDYFNEVYLPKTNRMYARLSKVVKPSDIDLPYGSASIYIREYDRVQSKARRVYSRLQKR